VDTALRGEWVEAGLLADPEPDVLGCGGGQRHVALTPEGDLYPCSHARCPEYYLGNLLNDDLADVWDTGTGRAGRLRYAAGCQGVRCPCQKGVALPRLELQVTSRH
jgi:radical SAM protein with 4Fe4S-binding SPASM domain